VVYRFASCGDVEAKPSAGESGNVRERLTETGLMDHELIGSEEPD
jgi:hypothetical protein